MSNKKDATFHPGPLATYHAEHAAWLSGHMAGLAVGAPEQAETDPPPPKGMPTWAIAAIVLGAVLLLGSFYVAIFTADPLPTSPAVPAAVLADVEVSGTCEKKIIGEYGLVASIVAVNTSDEQQTGSLWVRWAMTGDDPKTFSQPLVLAPGDSGRHNVNQPVKAEPWFRTGACDFGWTPSSR